MKSNKKNIKVGLVGLRGINRYFYLPALQFHPHIEIIAGCDINEEVCEEFEKEYGVKTFTKLKEMLSAVELDGVFIGTPNPFHFEHIIEAAEKKVHIFVTKPITNTVKEAKEAISVCKKNNLILQVGHEYRFRPVIRAIKQKIINEEIGKVSSIHIHIGSNSGLSSLTGPGQWRSKSENVPGGCMNLLGIHCFDTLNSLLGRPKSVFAMVKKLFTPSEIEDISATLIEYYSGKIAFGSSSYISAHSDWIIVYGTEANLIGYPVSGELFLQKNRKLELLDIPKIPSSAEILVEQFYQALVNETNPETAGEEGLLALAIMEGSLISEKEKRIVEIKEILKVD
jgi:predicted dehydrogenase